MVMRRVNPEVIRIFSVERSMKKHRMSHIEVIWSENRWLLDMNSNDLTAVEIDRNEHDMRENQDNFIYK